MGSQEEPFEDKVSSNWEEDGGEFVQKEDELEFACQEIQVVLDELIDSVSDGDLNTVIVENGAPVGDRSGSANGSEEAVDPRIEHMLEELNQWTKKINSLEIEFEEANNNFRAFLTESSDKLKNVARKIGIKCVAEVRPYYDTKDRARDYQKSCQRTVLAYDRACQSLLQAKEEIELTESKFRNQSSSSPSGEQLTPDFDVTWQEMLNQATIKVRDAEKQKKTCKANHERCMKEFMAAEEQIAIYEKKLKTSIKKTKPYFDESYLFKCHLLKIKTEIDMLNEKIVASKSCYAVTLKDLESISEEIHERRNSRLIMSLRREPGVGAEINNGLNGSRTLPNHHDSLDYMDIVPELKVTSSKQPRPSSGSSHAETTSSEGGGYDNAFSSSCDTSFEGEHQQQLHLNQKTIPLKLKDDGFEEVALD